MVGESWMTTQFDSVADWARRHSFWPLPFGTACCAIEFMSTVSSHYDLARFGYEVVRFSPRQSDLLIVAGTCSGGFYRAYHVMQGIDEIIPVDVYVPGCPPTPEGLMYGILQLREKVERDRKRLGRRLPPGVTAEPPPVEGEAEPATKAS